MPHRNDAAASLRWSPDHHHKPATELAGRLKTDFRIIESVVLDRHNKPREDIGRLGEIQSSLSEGQGALCGSNVISTIICSYNKSDWQEFL
jgi:hypothetical protein